MKQVLNGVTATGASAVTRIRKSRQLGFGLTQVDSAGGTATVVVEGRTTKDMAWVPVHTFTLTSGQADAESVALFPEMRLNITVIAGATVDGTLTDR